MRTNTIKEDVTTPGTGLGMSIVKQIVDLSGGKIEIKSNQIAGTSVKLSLPLANCGPASKDLLKSDSLYKNEDPVESVRRRAGGRTVSILGFDDPSGRSELQLQARAYLKATISKYSSEWFGLKLVPNGEAADIAIGDESAYLDDAFLERRYGMILILCSSGARRDISSSRLHSGQIVEFVSKPCGPHRLAKALLNCLDIEDGTPRTPTQERVGYKGPQINAASPEKTLVTAGTGSSSRLVGDLQSSIGFSPTVLNRIRTPSLSKTVTTASLADPINPTTSSLHDRRVASTAAAADFENVKTSEIPELCTTASADEPQTSSTPQINHGITSDLDESRLRSPDDVLAVPRKPVMLLVEDNPVNMMLLATYMKKNKWEFEKASNGLIALEAFRERPGGFDVIFMDVSMPVMTGYESTRHIRMLETERRLAYEHQNLTQTTSCLSTTTTSNGMLPSSFPFNLQAPYPTPSTGISTHLPLRSGSISSSSTSTINQTPNQTPNSTFPFPPPSQTIHPFPTSPSSFSPPFSDLNFRLELPRLKLNSPALIIALTGFSSQKDQEMAFEVGVDIFMTKPVRFKEVRRILERWMSGSAEGGEGLGVVGEGRDIKG